MAEKVGTSFILAIYEVSKAKREKKEKNFLITSHRLKRFWLGFMTANMWAVDNLSRAFFLLHVIWADIRHEKI